MGSALDSRKLGKDLVKLTRSIAGVNKAYLKKLPKVNILQAELTPADCVGLLSSCYGTESIFTCGLDRFPAFISCLTSGQEPLVTNVPCGKQTTGDHYMPYSVYQDWLGCTDPSSDGVAECDDFTITDKEDREITTKIQCDCPKEKAWDGHRCGCPSNKPFDELQIEEAGGRMIGKCCAVTLCGEGGDYHCDDDECECAPGWFDDGMGGCVNEACSPGRKGGTGCARNACCTGERECVIDEGEWDGQENELAPRTISGCKVKGGRWITTDEDKCPEEGHCRLPTCTFDMTYQENKFMISRCDPNCLGSACAKACTEADNTKCGGTWEFDSCDNKGTPSSCLCACVP